MTAFSKPQKREEFALTMKLIRTNNSGAIKFNLTKIVLYVLLEEICSTEQDFFRIPRI